MCLNEALGREGRRSPQGSFKVSGCILTLTGRIALLLARTWAFVLLFQVAIVTIAALAGPKGEGSCRHI